MKNLNYILYVFFMIVVLILDKSSLTLISSIYILCLILDLFWFQRMDLGECPKIHDLALRADYDLASKKQDYYYDIDVS